MLSELAAVFGLTFLGLPFACATFAVLMVLSSNIILMLLYPVLKVGVRSCFLMGMIVQAVVSLVMLAAFVLVVKNVVVGPTQGRSLSGEAMDFGVQHHAVQGQLFLAAGAFALMSGLTIAPCSAQRPAVLPCVICDSQTNLF